jgi:hypothetical protein
MICNILTVSKNISFTYVLVIVYDINSAFISSSTISLEKKENMFFPILKSILLSIVNIMLLATISCILI